MTARPSSTWDTRYEWRAVSLLSLGFGLLGLDRFMIQPLFPVMMRELQLSYQNLGEVSGILAVTWGCSALFSGRLADRVGHRAVLIPATVVFSTLAGLTGAVTGLYSLLIIRAVMGVSEGAFAPVSVAATLAASKPARHGRNIGIQAAMVPFVGLGLAPIIATEILRLFSSWRWVFLIVSIPGFVIAFLFWRTLRNLDAATADLHALDHAPAIRRWSDLFKIRNIPLNIAGMLCWLTALTTLGAFLPSYLVDHLHLSLLDMGFVMSAIGFGGGAGSLVMPALSDRIGRKPVLGLGVLVGTGCIFALTQTGASPQLLFIFLFFSMWSIFANIAMTIGPLTLEAVPAGVMTTAAGIVGGAGEVLGGGVAPALSGFVAQHYGIQAILHVALYAMLAGVVVALAVKETSVAHKV